MSDDASAFLLQQLALAWKLASYHLEGLADTECLWRPAPSGPHVWYVDGQWRADWPEHEGYEAGPVSIAWLTWHMGFWWSMVLNHSFGDGTLERQQVLWPGSAVSARQWLGALQAEWRAAIAALGPEDLRDSRRTRWPYQDRPFGHVVAWVYFELAKNAAEIGYARFLYAVKK